MKIALEQTAYLFRGNTPFIITICHDGFLTKLNGKELPFAKNKKENDRDTRKMAMLIRNFSSDCIPNVICQQVERSRFTNEIRIYFYMKVLELAQYCLRTWGICYLIDLHAFGSQMGGSYDLIFGTNHRGTVNNDFDNVFSKLLKKGTFFQTRNLQIYIPQEIKMPSERFGATKDSTLVKWLSQREPGVNAIQVEIYKDWLKEDPKMIALATEVSFAIALLLKPN